MSNTQPQQRSEIGTVGLGMMGRNFSPNASDRGFSVIAVDPVDLKDKKPRRRLHEGVKKFSRRGMVKTNLDRT